MDTRRFMLFGALGLVLLMLWDSWVAYTTPARSTALKPATEITAANSPAPADSTVSGTTQKNSAQNNNAVPQAPPASTASSSTEQVTAVSDTVQVPDVNPGDLKPRLPTGKRITVITDLLKVEIDSMGGDIRKVELLKLPVSVDKPDQPFVLMTDTGKDLFVAQSGLAVNGNRKLPNHNTRFTAEQSQYQLSSGQDEVTARLNWQGPDGVRYSKYFRFRRNSYIVDVGFDVDNSSAREWKGNYYAQLVHSKPQKKSGSSSFFTTRIPSYQGAAIYTPENKFEKVKFDDMVKNNLQRDASGGWVSMIQHYFTSAWLPGEQGQHRIYSRYQQSPQGDRYYIGYTDKSPVRVAAGQKGNLHSLLYVGPKDQDRLSKAAEGLVLSVDYGWLTPVSNPLFWILRHIHSVIGNWGWSIILLTLFVKICFYPLSAASFRSMAKMKQLQPRLKTLKERYGDDRQKMNAAMMEMYKKDKINPLGGCLPMIVQIPVFIALYWVLLESVELRQAPFMFWIHDLAIKDPYYVLPLLMGASMFGQQLLNPTPVDPMQKNIMMAMPVVFTVFFLFFPAGLVVYWLTNNILSISQQWYITKNITAAKHN